MDTGKPQLPWERPQVAMILSIFGGKVASITTVSKVQRNIGGADGDRVQG
jgi:hypothetical protein